MPHLQAIFKTHTTCPIKIPTSSYKVTSLLAQRQTHTDTTTILTFTLEEALDAEVGHCEAQDRQFVQLGDDIWGERQQAGQPVQLSVQPVPVPLGRVGFLVGRGGFPGEEMDRAEIVR